MNKAELNKALREAMARNGAALDHYLQCLAAETQTRKALNRTRYGTPLHEQRKGAWEAACKTLDAARKAAIEALDEKNRLVNML